MSLLVRALRPLVVPLGPIAAGTVVVVCEPTPLGPIADGLVAVRGGTVPPGPMLLGHWGQLDSARAGFLHRYVPLHHGGAVDDAVVVDGLRSSEGCASGLDEG